MQQIVVVEQSDVIPGGHLKAGIRVSRNAQVLLQPLVLDPQVLPHILAADPLHIAVGFIAAVRHAQFPVRIRLVDDRPDHLVQELFRRIVKGNYDAEFDAPREHLCPLGFQFLFRKERCIRQRRILLPVLQLVLDLVPRIAPSVLVQASDTLAYQTKKCHFPQNALQRVKAHAERFCYLPEKRVGDRAVGILYPRQLDLQRFTLTDGRVVMLLVVRQLRFQRPAPVSRRMILVLILCQLCFQCLTLVSCRTILFLAAGQLCPKPVSLFRLRLALRLFAAERLLHPIHLGRGRCF